MQTDKQVYLQILKNYKDKLTRQQLKTFKGQILSGDYIGFQKGLKKVMNK